MLDQSVNLVKDVDGRTVIGEIITDEIVFRVAMQKSHRIRPFFLASAIVGGAATVVMSEIIGGFDLGPSAPTYPDDVNSEGFLVLPDIPAAFSPSSKVFDRFLAASQNTLTGGKAGKPILNYLEFTITPVTSITLALAHVHFISYT